MKCECCQTEHDGSYGSGRFCSEFCSRSFSGKSKRQKINKLKGQIKVKEYIDKICPECLSVFTIRNVVRENKKFCSDLCWRKYNGRKGGLKSSVNQQRRSKNEIYFYELCKKQFKNVKHNENIFNGWDADIIIEDFKIAVLWNGKWHYEKLKRNHSLIQVQNRDKIKINEIKKLGYSCYIIKDLGKYNKDFVENEFNKFARWTGVGTSRVS